VLAAVTATLLALCGCGGDLLDLADEDDPGPELYANDTVSLPLTTGALKFDDGFESGTLSGFIPHTKGGTFSVANAPVFAGQHSGKFDLAFSAADGNYRAEAYLADGKGNFAFGHEYWMSLKYYFDDWAIDRSSESAPLQVHSRPGSWDSACTLGSAYSTAPLFLITNNDTMRFVTYGGKPMWSAPIQKKKWLTMTIHFKPSTGDDGYVEAWFNGSKIGRVDGANQPKVDNCGLPMRGPYFNVGIYKWDWRQGRPATQSSHRNLFVDAVRIAEGPDAYALVTGSKPATDGGTPASDGGIPASDGGTPASDGGKPASDGGTPAKDGGTPVKDGGTPAKDGGTPASDGGTSSSATMIINNGFESGTLNGFNCSGNCPKVVTSPTASGNYSGYFDLTRSMVDKGLTMVDPKPAENGIFEFGKEYWLGFNYRYEDWAPDSDSDAAPVELHTRPSSWGQDGGVDCQFHGSMGHSPFLMATANDQAKFITYPGKVLWTGPVQKNQWLGMTIHFKISMGSDGYIEAWKDGVKLGRVDGANSPKLDGCGGAMRAPYLKMGVYKWNWRKYATDSSRRLLILDNLKLARGANGYSMVSPD
jgi:hypothetical protein